MSEGRWDAAKQRVDERGTGAGDAFDEALASERDKEERLEDLFRQARDKFAQEPEEEEDR